MSDSSIPAVHTARLRDGRTVRLGRIRPKARPPALLLASYLTPMRASIPPSVDYTAKAQAAIAQMYGNDQYGDCVIAGHFHSAGIWTGNETGNPAVGTTQEALEAYAAICGPNDQGCVITDVLDVFQKTGLTIAGRVHKIDGYVAVNWQDPDEVKVALFLFGALTLGVNLPQAWEDDQTWDVTSTPIVGGHDVTVAGYDAQGVTVLTWGGTRKITWAAFTAKTWVEECYAPLAPDWYANNNLAPCGVDVTALRDDLAKIGNGQLPPIEPTPMPPNPNPSPTPTPTPGPTPSPVPTPAPVAGLTLEQTIEALTRGINDGKPYHAGRAAADAIRNATAAVTAAWPAAHR